ncbi:hypothetical protein [Streptomyces sp. NPDC018584]|uniref:hypothetical protein n=1 Tax=unclassified Streptomyces TaxID=2593676 RepID=UPI0037873E59
MTGQDHFDERAEDEFANAVFVRADEPNDEAGIGITREELRMCAAAPLRLVVLMHWRLREMEGQPRTAEAIWAKLTELGMYSDDGETPVRLGEVGDAVRFLLSQGVITAASGEAASCD